MNKYNNTNWQMPLNSGSFWGNPTLGQDLGTLSNIQNNVPQLTPPQVSPQIPGTTGKKSLTDKINNMGELGQMALMSGAGITGNVLGNALAGGKTSGVGNTIGTIGSSLGGIAGTVIGGPLGGIVGSFAGNLMGGVWNSMFGSKMNYENINKIENELNLGANYNSSANNFEELTQEIMNAPSLSYFSKSDIGSDGLFSNKASRKFRELSARKKFVEDWISRSQANAATNLQQNQLNDQLMGWFAYGGNLNKYNDGGGIHIKPENRGKFTALKERTGKSATWFKEHGTPAQKKMATFALNAAKWHHAFGGDLLSNGVEWDNGITVINNGGTHEESPYEGVQMGVDPQGIPNLVEEGEVIWNDYVFSNRIPVPNAVRSKYKLRGAKDMTFADAAKKVSKESEEMPNDNIAQRGLQDIMSKLAYEQEVIREQRNMNNKNKFKKGGPKYTKQQVGQAAWDAYLSSLKNDDNNILLRRPSASRFYDTTTLKPQDKIPSLQYYNLTRQSNNKTYNNNDDDLLDRDNLLRYAPVVGSAIGLGQTLFNKPDYSRADALAQYAQNAGKITPISYDPLGNYLTYRPKDIDYIANRMAAQAGATRRNIMNTAGGNRAMALAGLAAQDYSSQLAQAEAIRQADESNFNRGIQVETFNRGTNQYNSEAALKAAMANQEARMKANQLGLSGYSTAMQMKDAIDAQRNASINANLTNLFDSLGQIGEEIYDKNRLKWMERKGVLRSDYFDTNKYRKKYGGHINKGGK